ncbi:MAG: PQQ-binding-like beta-propeller repeat protein, partial [Acidobacteriota bacterium]|nr:PQQ-binding-like beta-propeller repeat protein [Acidobacteriota bacterium]
MRDCILAAVALLLLGPTVSLAQTGALPGRWLTYGGDAGSTRYSPLDQIDENSLERLKVAWRWDSPDNAVVVNNRAALSRVPSAFKATPVLIDGVLYIKTSMSQAAAIDAATGETKWVFDPGIWDGFAPANTGFNSRGVAYWSDGVEARIFLPTGDAYLSALDAATGRPIAQFGADGAVDATQGLRRPIAREEYQLMSAPLVVGDVVVIGSVVFDGPRYQLAPPGDVRGFDVRTGEELWEFHTIPQPGEFGNDTWEDGSWRDTGATNAWGSLSADSELGYVYIPTSTPTNDWYGGHRPGDNLFAESIVCLDAETGERVWHFQFVHHGLWDYDATAAPLLVDLVVDGRPIKAVAVVTKQAYTYVFDRITGEPVWPIEERPVPPSLVPGERSSPTQPHPTKPPPFDRQGFARDDLIDFTPELRSEAEERMGAFTYGPLFEPPSRVGNGTRGTSLMHG